MGFYDSNRYKQSFYDMGEAACLILKRESGQNGITLMRFAVYHSFESRTNVFNEYDNRYSDNEYNYFLATKVFAQVRIFMKYRNQADTGGSTAFTISSITRSSSSDDTEEKSINHNIYVPIQPAD